MKLDTYTVTCEIPLVVTPLFFATLVTGAYFKNDEFFKGLSPLCANRLRQLADRIDAANKKGSDNA